MESTKKGSTVPSTPGDKYSPPVLRSAKPLPVPVSSSKPQEKLPPLRKQAPAPKLPRSPWPQVTLPPVASSLSPVINLLPTSQEHHPPKSDSTSKSSVHTKSMDKPAWLENPSFIFDSKGQPKVRSTRAARAEAFLEEASKSSKTKKNLSHQGSIKFAIVVERVDDDSSTIKTMKSIMETFLPITPKERIISVCYNYFKYHEWFKQNFPELATAINMELIRKHLNINSAMTVMKWHGKTPIMWKRDLQEF